MIATFLIAAAGAATAHGYIPTGHRTGDPLPPGCARVHAAVPSGKIVHAPAPVRCAPHQLSRLERPVIAPAAPAQARE